MSIRMKGKDKKDKEKKTSTTSSPSPTPKSTPNSEPLTPPPSDGAQPATRSWKKKHDENENQKTLKSAQLNSLSLESSQAQDSPTSTIPEKGSNPPSRPLPTNPDPAENRTLPVIPTKNIRSTTNSASTSDAALLSQSNGAKETRVPAKCTRCNKDNNRIGSKYCGGCGTKLDFVDVDASPAPSRPSSFASDTTPEKNKPSGLDAFEKHYGSQSQGASPQPQARGSVLIRQATTSAQDSPSGGTTPKDGALNRGTLNYNSMKKFTSAYVQEIKRPMRASEVVIETRWAQKKQTVQATESSNLQEGPELDLRRSYIVGEIVSTEKTYLDSLNQFCTKYQKKFQQIAAENAKLPSIELIPKVFSNIDTIYSVSENLYSLISAAFQKWTPTSKVGDIFVKNGPYLKHYANFSSNYDTAIKSLDELYKHQWWSSKAGDRLVFESMLILPIQRIPRYRLLLEDLIKHTPSKHVDFKDLNEALGIVKEAATHVNSTIELTHNSEIINNLGLFHLLTFHRRLVLEAVLSITLILMYDGSEGKSKKGQKVQYHFLLFNDILVFVKQRKENTLNTKKTGTQKIVKLWDDEFDVLWPLELVWLKPIDDTSFQVIGPEKTITVEFPDKKEKVNWWNKLTSGIQESLEHIFPNVIPNAAEKLEEREGKHTFPSGSLYYGKWNLGRMHPYGCLEYKGTYYEGDFMMNVMGLDGKGTMEFADGTIYQGQFRSGKPHGQGAHVSGSGDRYDGAWHKGKRHGKGVASYANGDKYDGTWSFNRPTEGTLELKSVGTTYVGQFSHGKYHGKGELRNLRGKYVGDFEGGYENGEGTLVTRDGFEYTGSFKKGLKSGNGTLKCINYEYTGQFAKDAMEGKGKLVYTDGSVYDGNFQNGLRHGKGTYSSKTNFISLYNGDWEYDCRSGQGTLVYFSGETYVGIVVDGLPHGAGRLTLNDGTVMDGKWIDGVLEGKLDVAQKSLENHADHWGITVDEEGNVVSKSGASSAEYLAPPFFPMFQFQ